MDLTALKRWACQPTTIHAFGAIAFGILGAVSHYFGASPDVAAGIGLAGYVLVHAGINDSTASKPLEKLLEDGVNGYLQNRLAGLMPAVMADAPAAITALLSSSNAASAPPTSSIPPTGA